MDLTERAHLRVYEIYRLYRSSARRGPNCKSAEADEIDPEAEVEKKKQT